MCSKIMLLIGGTGTDVANRVRWLIVIVIAKRQWLGLDGDVDL